ncbi:Hypothetical predicted protein, partial [Marmota monax]
MDNARGRLTGPCAPYFGARCGRPTSQGKQDRQPHCPASRRGRWTRQRPTADRRGSRVRYLGAYGTESGRCHGNPAGRWEHAGPTRACALPRQSHNRRRSHWMAAWERAFPAKRVRMRKGCGRDAEGGRPQEEEQVGREACEVSR